MENTVSFETAKRLKEAGFPQPVPEFGQFWYAPNGVICVMWGNGVFDGEARVMIANGNTIYIKTYDIVFAPTATDILKEIPFVSLSFEVYETRFEFRVWEGLKLIAKHENPHDAAALAWLSIQEIQKK